LILAGQLCEAIMPVLETAARNSLEVEELSSRSWRHSEAIEGSI
jgi:hypothetical protein